MYSALDVLRSSAAAPVWLAIPSPVDEFAEKTVADRLALNESGFAECSHLDWRSISRRRFLRSIARSFAVWYRSSTDLRRDLRTIRCSSPGMTAPPRESG